MLLFAEEQHMKFLQKMLFEGLCSSTLLKIKKVEGKLFKWNKMEQCNGTQKSP